MINENIFQYVPWPERRGRSVCLRIPNFLTASVLTFAPDHSYRSCYRSLPKWTVLIVPRQSEAIYLQVYRSSKILRLQAGSHTLISPGTYYRISAPSGKTAQVIELIGGCGPRVKVRYPGGKKGRGWQISREERKATVYTTPKEWNDAIVIVTQKKAKRVESNIRTVVSINHYLDREDWVSTLELDYHAGERLADHIHFGWELIINMYGTGHVRALGELWEIAPGFIFLPAGTPHSWYCSPKHSYLMIAVYQLCLAQAGRCFITDRDPNKHPKLSKKEAGRAKIWTRDSPRIGEVTSKVWPRPRRSAA